MVGAAAPPTMPYADFRCVCVRTITVVFIVLELAIAPCVAGANDGSVKGKDSAPVLESNDVRDRLRALKAGHGLNLGNARVVGEFNDVARAFSLDRTGPRARDFSIKMVWVPERNTALFLGANHGSPHRLNDVWEFDLGAMTWRLLYAPDNPRSYAGLGKDPSDVVFKDGVLMTRRGGPAVIGHTWWGVTYDTTARQVVYMNTWATDQDKAIIAVGGDPDQRYKGPPLWRFDPADKAWGVIKSERPYPRAPFAGLLEYVEPLGGVIWHSNNWQMRATWLFHTETGVWEKLAEHGTEVNYLGSVPLQEQVGYYDPGRKLLVVSSGTRTSHFDIQSRQWVKVVDEPKGSDRVPDAHDASTAFHYDSLSSRGILLDFKTNTIWSYDPGGGAWTKLEVRGDQMPEGRKRLAYLDLMSGLVVILKDKAVWTYRY